MNIWALRSNFVDCEYFFESNSPDILTLCETNLDDSIDSDDLCVGLSSFNPKGFYYSCAWSRSLCWGRTSFCTRRVSRKLCRLLCFRLALLQSVSYFFLSTAHFFRISARFLILVHLTKVRFSRSTHLLMCLSLNFNVQHKDWLTYSDGTDRPGELSYNFS